MSSATQQTQQKMDSDWIKEMVPPIKPVLIVPFESFEVFDFFEFFNFEFFNFDSQKNISGGDK